MRRIGGQSRTWCDPAVGMYKSSSWTPLLFSTQPTVVRLNGGYYKTWISIQTHQVIFLIYHFIGTFSKNAAEDGTISATFGSIISTLIILPLSIYLFRRASMDKEIFSIEYFSSKFLNFFKIKNEN